MTIHWKAAEQYFTVVLFVFQFYPELCTVSSERVKKLSVLVAPELTTRSGHWENLQSNALILLPCLNSAAGVRL